MSKQVTFSQKPTIHYMVTWKFAYKECRKKWWENVAIDRIRFERRISQLSSILEPIFENMHRCKIYKERFK